MNTLEDLEKEFDIKFTRKDLSKKGVWYRDDWFVKDAITSKEIKQFYRQSISELLKSLVVEDCIPGIENLDDQQLLDLEVKFCEGHNSRNHQLRQKIEEIINYKK